MGRPPLHFRLVALANLLPVAAYFLLGLPFAVLVVLFWVDVVVIFLCYAGVAMVSKPEQQIERRERIVPVGPSGDRFLPDSAWQPSRRLPPIYPRNLRFVVPSVIFFLVMSIAAAGGLTVSGVGSRAGRREDGNVLDFFAQLSVLEELPVLVIALCIVAVHLVVFWQHYGRGGRDGTLTAHMALEIPVSYVVLYFLLFIGLVLYAIAAVFAVDLAVPDSIPDGVGIRIWEVAVAGPFLASKLALERSRLRGEEQSGLDDGSFVANFSPTPPPTDRAGEDRGE